MIDHDALARRIAYELSRAALIDPSGWTYADTAALIAKHLREALPTSEDAEHALRDIACYVGAGDYNSDEVQKVTLRPAYAWDCEECGRENFARGLVPEFSPDDLATLREEMGIDNWDTGDVIALPEEVHCRHCSATFKTVHYRNNDDI